MADLSIPSTISQANKALTSGQEMLAKATKDLSSKDADTRAAASAGVMEAQNQIQQAQQMVAMISNFMESMHKIMMQVISKLSLS